MNDLSVFEPYIGGDVYYRAVNLQPGLQNYYLFRERFSGIDVVDGKVWIEMQTNTVRNRFENGLWIDGPILGHFIDQIIPLDHFLRDGVFEFRLGNNGEMIFYVRPDFATDFVFYQPGKNPILNPYQDFPKQAWTTLADVFAP